MKPNRPSVIEELEGLGYEARIVDQHVSVLNTDGHEVLRLFLAVLDQRAGEAGASGYRWVSVLPADILGRRD